MQTYPITPQVRLVTIDILRGFALLGILLAHFIYWHTGGPLPGEVYTKDYGIPSRIADGFHSLLIFGKFFTFFAFLFGVSFHLQITALEKSGINVNTRFTRRLVILFAIGMLHHLFWMGDILSIYATLGLSLLFFRLLGNRALFIWAVILSLSIPIKAWDAASYLLGKQGGGQSFDSVAKAYYDAVKSGSLWEVIQFNASNLDTKIRFQLESGRASSTIGFFLLGMLAARKGYLDGSEGARLLLRRVLRKTALVMGVALSVGLLIMGANEIFKLEWQQNQVVGFFFGIIFDIFNAALVLVYISGFALLLYRPLWQKWLYPLNYIGKLALTSYLMQTVAGLLLFYHFGAGLFLKTSPATNYLIAFGIFFIQVLLAKWWVKYFYYGPVEWLWRSATIGKWQPFLKRNGA